MNKSDSTNTLEEVYLSNTSLLSDSTHFSDDASNHKLVQTQDLVASKRKNRFVSAFRSFRKKKSETKSSDDRMRTTDTESQQKPLKSENKRSRASSLVKRLSMSSIRRSKKSKNVNLKRETPEGATLSVSEISLIEIGVDENTSSSSLAVGKPSSKIPRQGDQLQITISGKKIERRKDSIVTPNSISDTKVSETEPLKPQRKSKQFNITVSDQDISPNVQAPPVPYSICGSDISVSSISTAEKISQTRTISSTGVIKKSSFRKQRNKPLTMSVSKSGSLERGRRFPRPNDDIQSDSASGNNLANPNSSGTVSDPPTGTDSHSKSSQSDGNIEEKPKIEFEVGTKVRPLSTSNLNRIDETTVIHSGRDEFSSLDTSKCSESSSESKSDTSRRRIAYVEAPIISFSEDEPGAADSILSREPLSHLSGISEYNSLDSDFSLPSYFGDVIDDDGVGCILLIFLEFVFRAAKLCRRVL